MAGADLTALSVLIDKTFHDPFMEELADDSTIIGRFKHTKGESDKYRLQIHHGGNTGMKSYAEGDALAAAGAQQYAEAEWPFAMNEISIKVTGKAEAATAGKGGYMQAIASELDGALPNLKDFLNDQALDVNAAPAATDIDGIPTIIQDTGTYGNIARTNSYWKPYVIDNGGVPRDLTIALMQDVAGNLRTPEHKSKLSVIMGSWVHFYHYGNLLTDLRRYRPNETMDGGFKALDFEGVPLIAVPNMAAGDLFFLDESVWEYRIWVDFKTEERSVFEDARQWFIKHYSQLICKSPRKQGRISDLKTS